MFVICICIALAHKVKNRIVVHPHQLYKGTNKIGAKLLKYHLSILTYQKAAIVTFRSTGSGKPVSITS